MNKVVERETYSFTISNKSNIEIAMKDYINNKIKSGTKMSSYIRYLIEKDMMENNVVVEGYNYPSIDNNNNSSLANNNELLTKLNNLEEMISENIKYNGQNAYDKLVGLEYLVKELSSSRVNLNAPIGANIGNTSTNIDITSILNRLDLLSNLINSKDNSSFINYDLEFKNLFNKINTLETALNKDTSSENNIVIEKLSDIESLVSEQASSLSFRDLRALNSTVEKLADKITTQTEVIEALQDTIANQNQLIKMLNMGNVRNVEVERTSTLTESYDVRRELAKKKAANMVESEF